MNSQLEIRKCNVCGTVIEVLEDCGNDIGCCGRAMETMPAKSYAAGRQRHIPVVEQLADGIHVTVGQLPHLMSPDHFIQWIELTANGQNYRQFLHPGMLPQAFFELNTYDLREVQVRLMCNKDGLWSSSTPLVGQERHLVLAVSDSWGHEAS